MLPHFSTLSAKYAKGMKKRHGQERLSWPAVQFYLETSWLAGYAFGIRETTRLYKTPCTLRKRRV